MIHLFVILYVLLFHVTLLHDVDVLQFVLVHDLLLYVMLIDDVQDEDLHSLNQDPHLHLTRVLLHEHENEREQSQYQ